MAFSYIQKPLKGFDFYVPEIYFQPPFCPWAHRDGEMVEKPWPRTPQQRYRNLPLNTAKVDVGMKLDRELFDDLKKLRHDLRTWDMNKVIKYLFETKKECEDLKWEFKKLSKKKETA